MLSLVPSSLPRFIYRNERASKDPRIKEVVNFPGEE
jgi:hypothetical protein